MRWTGASPVTFSGVQVPPRDQLRADLGAFDEVRTKVVGGVLAVMFASPEKIQDRNWMAEQFTQVALLTGQFDDAGDPSIGVAAVEAWVQGNIHPVLNACYALFVHVAEDMRQQHGGEPFSASDAMIQALGYFDGPTG